MVVLYSFLVHPINELLDIEPERGHFVSTEKKPKDHMVEPEYSLIIALLQQKLA
jgi:hypothetical protein